MTNATEEATSPQSKPKNRFKSKPRRRPEGKPQTADGVLELADNGNGYLRSLERNFASQPGDAFVPSNIIQRLGLRPGVEITGQAAPSRRGRSNVVRDILTINGRTPEEWRRVPPFEDLVVIDPREAIHFEQPGGPAEMRVVDLMTPIGKGQRGLIVAPPRSGKTVLLKQLAAGVAANHPEIMLIVLLVDERPEEVTDMKRNVNGHVFHSSNDSKAENHARIARIVSSYARRHTECGKDVFILLDSLTRLGRTFNTLTGGSKRTMTGGLDIRALEEPKRIFGSARNIEHGGSLTIIATALIDTGSRMDDFIFQEFKGTGNMEIVLDREMAERRMYPTIDLRLSGTRKEELLLGRDATDKIAKVRRQLLDLRSSNTSIMETLLRGLKNASSNQKFLELIPAG
ncbi:MAG: transcription termination factor Rho [Candidatus Schekmanbacteria bacterium]|nr:transcription termination factor Rho [Candidatus Schekmanbacteria bacterium]